MARTVNVPGRAVLVVEDEVRIRTMLAAALKQMNYTATLVSSGEDGLKALQGAVFDIVILDLNMPGMGGMDFLERVRRKDSEIQAIILTGFGDLEAARRAIQLEVAEFLTKPCSLGSLEIALDRASKRRRKMLGMEAGPAALQATLQFEDEAPKPLVAGRAAELPETASGSEARDREDGDGEALEDLERRQILKVLHKHNGNRAAAANELGISQRKLYYRLGEYQKKGWL